MHSKMRNPVLYSRTPKPKRRLLSKSQIDMVRYFVSLAILGCSIVGLFLTWGAMEIEEFANRQYELEPKFNTDSTCFFSKFDDEDNVQCTRIVKNAFHRVLAYYGIRLDCALSTPMIVISLWFFWQDSYSKTILLMAHICGWTKSISIAAAVTCVLIDDPSFLREIFEKSQFGTYESKILYAFTMALMAVIADFCLLVTLSFAPFVPDKVDSKYVVQSHHLKQYNNCRVRPSNTQVVAKKNNTTSLAVVETIESDERTLEEKFLHLASPV